MLQSTHTGTPCLVQTMSDVLYKSVNCIVSLYLLMYCIPEVVLKPFLFLKYEYRYFYVCFYSMPFKEQCFCVLAIQ
jgi:hypothetical protein